MKNYVIILIGVIIALVIVGGAVAYISMQNTRDNNSTIQTNISNATNATSGNSSTTTTGNSTSGPYVVNETIKFNAQQGEGYFREVTYSDGNFRQYDVDTGKLIGSSYASDQDKLPSME